MLFLNTFPELNIYSKDGEVEKASYEESGLKKTKEKWREHIS